MIFGSAIDGRPPLGLLPSALGAGALSLSLWSAAGLAEVGYMRGPLAATVKSSTVSHSLAE